MSSYESLAGWYDILTEDVPYNEFADFYENLFAKINGEKKLLLDLCCGTGTLTRIMTERGYELISVDKSEQMLMQARDNCQGLNTQPLFLCQDAVELDLYGTVDAAFCSLDGINYIDPEDLSEVFRRLHLFIRPDGMLVFDIKTPDSFKELDGQTFVDETEDVLCLWRADFDDEENIMYYGMDIFSKEGMLWKRDSEEHLEFAHSESFLEKLLSENGFTNINFSYDGPQNDKGRLFISAIRGDNNG